MKTNVWDKTIIWFYFIQRYKTVFLFYKPLRGYGPKSNLEVSDGHHTKRSWQWNKTETNDLDQLATKRCHLTLEDIVYQPWKLIHKPTRIHRLSKINQTPLKQVVELYDSVLNNVAFNKTLLSTRGLGFQVNSEMNENWSYLIN